MESEMWKEIKKSVSKLFSSENNDKTVQKDNQVKKNENLGKPENLKKKEDVKNKKNDPDEASKVENEHARQVEHAAGEEKMKPKDDAGELKNKGKLFVGGLHHQTTWKGLEKYFSQFGKVIDAVVMRVPESGRSRGFGFVMFAKASDAETALGTASHVLDGKSIDVRPFIPAKSEKDFRIFLGGLSENTTANVLRQFFGRYGEITNISIPVDRKTKKSKGFGFMTFESEEAVKKCLAEEFVHLGGRRIHIRKAEPRSSSQAPIADEMGEDCLESGAFSSEDLRAMDDMTNFHFADAETSSATSGERSEEDFHSSKWSNFNAMYKTETKEGKRDFKDLLAEFLASYNPECSISNENSTSLSEDTESEESSSGTHSECESDVSDDDNEDDSEKNADALAQLSTEFMKVLRCDPSDKGAEIPGLNQGGGGDGADHRPSPPLKFVSSKGSLFCSVCQWAPEKNSSESFLSHCQTAAHKSKLRERFPKDQIQAGKNTEDKKPKEKQADWQKKAPPQKPLPAVEQNAQKEHAKKQIQAKGEKQNQTEQKKATTTKRKSKKKAVKEGNEENKNTRSNSKPEEDKNERVINENLKGLKVMALAKGMSCIRPDSQEQLKCTMCNKKIPKAEDFNIVMKNVSQHLQSKLHLRKMLETENSLKESLEKKQNDSKSREPVKNPPNQKTQGKAFTQQQKAPDQGNVAKNAAGTKKSQNKSADSKLLFLCVPCNYFNKNIETFKAHLKSESHLDCFISRGVSTDLSFDNLTKCKTCDSLLYGSQYYISKHYNKCSEKKT